MIQYFFNKGVFSQSDILIVIFKIFFKTTWFLYNSITMIFKIILFFKSDLFSLLILCIVFFYSLFYLLLILYCIYSFYCF